MINVFGHLYQPHCGTVKCDINNVEDCQIWHDVTKHDVLTSIRARGGLRKIH